MRSPPPGILVEPCSGTITEPGLPLGLPGIIHYILLICENVSLDWSTMQLVDNYGCQQNAGSGPESGSIFFLKIRVGVRVDTNPNPNPNPIDPDLGSGRDPAFYWHPVITFEFQ